MSDHDLVDHSDPPSGENVRKRCPVPILRPIDEYLWHCDCRKGNRGLHFEAPASSIPCLECPVEMGEYTMSSDPVMAYPVCIDDLVTAACAARGALYRRKVLRPLLERSEIPAARLLAEITHHEGLLMDEAFEEDIRQQYGVLRDVGSSPAKTFRASGRRASSSDSDEEESSSNCENSSDGGESPSDSFRYMNSEEHNEKHKTEYKSRDSDDDRQSLYDIRNFREIHTMMHAAYDDPSRAWLVHLNDQNLLPNHEAEHHLHQACSEPGFVPGPDDVLDGCRRGDRYYWDYMYQEWLQKWNGNDFNALSTQERHDWFYGIVNKAWDRGRVEMENWTRKLIGKNGTHPWVQTYVIKILEEAFKGVKITIINPAVLGKDTNKGPRGIRNYMPMAWVHLDTQWKRTRNLPYVEVARSARGMTGTYAGPLQGYAPVIPRDLAHWYSNAARSVEDDPQGAVSKDSTPLTKFINLFQFEQWLHPLQWIPFDMKDAPRDDPTQDNREGKGKKSTASGGGKQRNASSNPLDPHERNSITRRGRERNFPELVVLRKVVHSCDDEEGGSKAHEGPVDWDAWRTSDPKSEGDLDYQEQKAVAQEIRDRLEKISHEVASHLDQADSYTWPADVQERDEHEQHSEMLTGIVQALQAEANRPNNKNAARHRHLIAGLEQFKTNYEARRERLRQGTEQVAKTRPELDKFMKEEIKRAKIASVDLDNLRRKRYRDVKGLRRRREILQGEKDHLNEKNKTLKEKKRMIGREKEMLKDEKGNAEREMKELQAKIQALEKENAQMKADAKKSTKRGNPGAGSKPKKDDSSSPSDDDNGQDKPPAKGAPKSDKKRGRSEVSPGPVSKTQKVTAGDKKTSGKATTKTDAEITAKAGKEPTAATTKPTTKTDTKSPSKPAAKPTAKTTAKPTTATTESLTVTPQKPATTITRITRSMTSSPALSSPAPAPSPAKPKAKTAAKAKPPAIAKTEPKPKPSPRVKASVKPPIKAPAKTAMNAPARKLRDRNVTK